MGKAGFSTILIIIIVAVTVVTVGTVFFVQMRSGGSVFFNPKPIACTMEAKLCPDGKTYVGRTGPRCEFAACPPSNPIPKPEPSPVVGKYCSGPSDPSCGPGYQCIQGCGPPVVRADEPPAPYYCETNTNASKPRMCPICLSSNTNIATPDGNVNIKNIRVGDKIWSLNKNGEKIVSKIIRTARTPVPQSHQMAHLLLSDGRQVWASPNHPTASGQLLGALQSGDVYDGATVEVVALIPYWDTATYDILPDSDTGFYYADEILLGNTLTNKN